MTGLNDIPDRNLLLLTTGENAILKERVGDELYSIDSANGDIDRCFLPEQKTLLERVKATGAFVRQSTKDSTYRALVCGGEDNSFSQYDCFRISPKGFAGVTAKSGNLGVPRQGAASVTLNDGTELWVTGGIDRYGSTEIIDAANGYSNTHIHNRPTLPKELAFHCLKQLQIVNKVILYGGEDTHSSTPLIQDSWTTDLDTDWIWTGMMSAPRKLHACGVLRANDGSDIVVAAGGLDVDNKVLDSVDLLLIEAVNGHFDSWILGPRMPLTLCDAASATTSDQKRLFVVGGTISYEPFEQSLFVFNFACNQENNDCKWAKNNLELWLGRSSGVAMMLPPFAKVFQEPEDFGTESTSISGMSCIFMFVFM